MQPIHIDTKSSVPLWSQIEQQIRLLVARGALTPGESVPSVRELARDLVVNPATVSKAYQRLCEMDVLEVRRGQGTFVTSAVQGTNQLAARAAQSAARELVALARAAGLNLTETKAVLGDAWHELRKRDTYTEPSVPSKAATTSKGTKK